MRKLKKYTPSPFMLKTSHYDKDAADFVVAFIEQLKHTKGEFYKQPFELIDWQEKIIRDIFGTLKPDGYRQFTTAYTRIKVSEELLNDSAFDLEGYFVSEFGRRIGNKEEEAFFTGNGSGKPTGILDGTAGADVGVTTTSASAITADEIIDLFYSLNVPYRKDAIWILNDSTLKAVRKLKDGTGQYLWQPALHEGSFDTLLGKRIFVSPYMPEIASGAKTVAFGDFKFYWIGDRQGITFRRLNELYAENGQVGFIASKRVDGKLILPEAIKVLKQKT